MANLGLSSSASAPEHLVPATIERLRSLVPALAVHELGRAEDVSFKLPSALLDLRAAGAGAADAEAGAAVQYLRKVQAAATGGPR